jgi:hypothetical protein
MALDTLERSAPPIFRQGLSTTSKTLLLGLLAGLLMAADHRLKISLPIRSAVALVLSPLQWVSLQPVHAVNALTLYFGNLEEAQDAAYVLLCIGPPELIPERTGASVADLRPAKMRPVCVAAVVFVSLIDRLYDWRCHVEFHSSSLPVMLSIIIRS